MAELQRTKRLATALLLVCGSACSYGQANGHGQVTFTVLPKHAGDTAQPVSQTDISLKVNGKDASITKLTAPGPDAPIEALLLLDGGARNLVGGRMDEIAAFVKALPPDIKFTIGYLQAGKVYLTGPMTTDRSVNLHGLLPPGGAPDSNGGIYTCISDIARRWPSRDQSAKREVILVADGQDILHPDQRVREKFGSSQPSGSNGIASDATNFDPSNIDVTRATADAVSARLVVSAIAWRSQSLNQNNTNTGQSYLRMVTDATGGKSFWEGSSNPPTLGQYLDDFIRRSQHQYMITFAAPLKDKPEVQQMALKVKASGIEVNSPQQVLVAPADKP